jgi:hypothetical protein
MPMGTCSPSRDFSHAALGLAAVILTNVVNGFQHLYSFIRWTTLPSLTHTVKGTKKMNKYK